MVFCPFFYYFIVQVQNVSSPLHNLICGLVHISEALEPKLREKLVYFPSSSDPTVADVEMVSGHWVIVANAPGTVVITVTGQSDETGSLTLVVNPADAIDLSANMEIRQEMVRLINQVRRENGKAELPTDESLMNAAQDVSSQCVTEHRPYDHKALIRYGWPFGGMYNLTAPVVYGCPDIAQEAVNNWVNSPGHLQTMLMEEA